MFVHSLEDRTDSTESDVTSGEREDVNLLGRSNTAGFNSRTHETKNSRSDATTGQEQPLIDQNPILEAAREGRDVSRAIAAVIKHAIENDRRYGTFENLVAECNALSRYENYSNAPESAQFPGLPGQGVGSFVVDVTACQFLFICLVFLLVVYRDEFSYFYRDFYEYVAQDPNSFPNFSFVFLPVVFICGLCFLFEKAGMVLSETDYNVIVY